jgi:hypothetical protein
VSQIRPELNAFFQAFWNEDRCPADDVDVFGKLGIEGDDAFEFIEAFADRFSVDMSDYRWYFHHAEEGVNTGSLFFPSPDQRVKRIAITPAILEEAIRSKRWPLHYPPHHLPQRRWDFRLNQLMLLASLVLVAIWGWRLFFG